MRFAAGQRWVSETEPELGLGLVLGCDDKEVEIEFRLVELRRRYIARSAPLKRVQFAKGETISLRDGRKLRIEAIQQCGARLLYETANGSIDESELADQGPDSSLEEQLRRGPVDTPQRLALRLEALCLRALAEGSKLRGLRGGRIQLLPHQLRVVHEVANRRAPRVLLADEVGLGKTIEAALIVHRLLRTGRASRVLFLVPEALIHQWLVELARRFAIWPTLLDKERCEQAAASAPDGNPFLDDALILTSLDLLLSDPARAEQAILAGFDVVVVDEAHRLRWSPDKPSVAWNLVDRLGQRSPALLLASATPEREGMLGHFARLRLLDPHRFNDPIRLEAEQAGWTALADLVDIILDFNKPLPDDLLERLPADPGGSLARRAAAALGGDARERDQLGRALLDRHGPGRVVFRSTRAAVGGFPQRQVRLHRLDSKPAQMGDPDANPADYTDDARIDWLVDLLRANPNEKIMVICRRPDQIRAIETALAAKLRIETALFHEELSLMQRDRLAAWFDDPEGARLLLCSEIGSEGRNMQRAQRLVLFDLPDDADVLEQRIGRLDRIGRLSDVLIEVPFLAGTAGERRARLFHEGLDAFSQPRPAAGAVLREFTTEIEPWLDGDPTPTADVPDPLFEDLLHRVAARHQILEERYRLGRDRLLEHNARRIEEGSRLVEQLMAPEPDLRNFLDQALSSFGATLEDLGGGRFHISTDEAWVEHVPGIPVGGLRATFDRSVALIREDLAFLTSDHPTVDALVEAIAAAPEGRASIATLIGDADLPALLALVVIEAPAPAGLAAGRFLQPTPLVLRADRRGVRTLEPADGIALARSCRPLRAIQFEALAVGLRPWLEKKLAAIAEETAAAASNRAHAALLRFELEMAQTLEQLEELRAAGAAIRDDEIAAVEQECLALRPILAEPIRRLDSLLLILPSAVDRVATP